MSDPDRVERTIELRAPPSRVWEAVGRASAFGTWFGLGDPLVLEGEFTPGARVTGRWNVGGNEVSELFCTVREVVPERLLAFDWNPYEVPAGEDPADHPTTRVELRLEEIPGGTRLTVVESGFASLPPDKQYKRDENGQGWAVQVRAIERHVLGPADVRVELAIARPPREVFEAIVDPEGMARHFFAGGTGRLAPGAKVAWEWGDPGVRAQLHVHQVEPDRRVTFVWTAPGHEPTKVTLALEPDGEGTRFVATEMPFALTAAGVKGAMRQTQGWTYYACSLKAWVVHGIGLRRAA